MIDNRNIKEIDRENANERFKRIVNPRLQKLIYELNRVIKMTGQPNYTICDVDAQKILEVIAPKFDEFIVLYQKIADGQELKTNKKTDIKDIF